MLAPLRFGFVVTIWVAELRISSRTAEKIIKLHRIQPDEVRAAVVNKRGLLAEVFEATDTQAKKALVKTWVRQRKARVVLFDAGDPLGGIWNLGSVYHDDW